MTTSELHPAIVARLASTVYGFMDLPTREALDEFKEKMGGDFDISAASIAVGKTGAGFVKCRSAFGFCAYGRGPFQGQD